MHRAPTATYRIQLSRAVAFRDLESLTPYLHALGVSDCYCSPILTAREGSAHGYDICNHQTLNVELGPRDELRDAAATLRSRGLGLIVDFVPNHMGIDPTTNIWWRDVLENGPSSPYAPFFDIDWLPIKTELRNKVLLPILGDQYGAVLERGELHLAYGAGTLSLDYFQHNLPINPGQSPLVLGHGLDRLVEALGDDHGELGDFRDILTKLTALPAMSQTDDASVALRQRDKEVLRQRLEALVNRSQAVREHIQRALEAFNGHPDEPRSHDLLHALLEVQAYRLAFWRTAVDEINYRRFFDINDLAGIRMEDERVFAATHGLLLELIAEGVISGLRLDHPDGLFDPEAYFVALKAALKDAVAEAASNSSKTDFYVVVEKILGRRERLRDSWPVHGTTGYDFLNVLNGVFVHQSGLGTLQRVYRRFTRYRQAPDDTVYAAKRFMMRTAMAGELNVLSRALNRLSEGDRRCRDFTLNGLRRAIAEVVACFPVYRTYVTAHGASPEDVAAVETAVREAERRNPLDEPSIFAFIAEHLAPASIGAGVPADWLRQQSVAFAQKLQQYSAPVVAKGVEDTAFYRDVLLLSANEVGGDLRARARTLAELHDDNRHRLARWPLAMTAGSTHDTKRGEDARARINVIAELADEWRAHVMRWSAINGPAKQRIDGFTAPDRNDEWLFYQALVGAWPAEALDAEIPPVTPVEDVERLQGFMHKATREAKRHTSWLQTNERYERAVDTFVRAVLAGDAAASFLASFVPFARRIAWFGMFGSLSQLVIRLASPGVPDIYQGSELWNCALVDPDNRRPVDFDVRRRWLGELEPALELAGAGVRQPASDRSALAATLTKLADEWPDGRIKLYTLAAALRFRREHAALFLHGDYEPLVAQGDNPHLVGFSRRDASQEVLAIAPRFVATLLGGVAGQGLGSAAWGQAALRLPVRLRTARLVNLFTAETIEPLVANGVVLLSAARVFQSWPVALLCVH